MPTPVKPIPERYHSITPNLVCRDAGAAIDFYKSVFGAMELSRIPGPGGKIMHAELKIGDSVIFVNDVMMGEPPALPAPGNFNLASLHLYVPDVDAVFNRAVAARARVDMPVQDMFWGDRYGRLTDPFGQQWSIATHIEDVAPDDMERRMKEMFAKSAG